MLGQEKDYFSWISILTEIKHTSLIYSFDSLTIYIYISFIESQVS